MSRTVSYTSNISFCRKVKYQASIQECKKCHFATMCKSKKFDNLQKKNKSIKEWVDKFMLVGQVTRQVPEPPLKEVRREAKVVAK